MRLGISCVFFGACLGCGVELGPEVEIAREAVHLHEFDVDFEECTEFAGITLVPRANALPFVPAGYTLAGDANNALVVVRVARCQSSVINGRGTAEITVAHVGVTLNGPDSSADINNYTVYFASDEQKLLTPLKKLGLDGEKIKDIGFTFSANGALSIDVDAKHEPDYQLLGTAVAPTSAPTTFTASWWHDGARGERVQMRTVFPAIRFGSASMTLTTPVGSELASLLGGTSVTFPVLDSYNAFPDAHMTVDTL
jgi:hypothetical protein